MYEREAGWMSTWLIQRSAGVESGKWRILKIAVKGYVLLKNEKNDGYFNMGFLYKKDILVQAHQD